MSSTYCTEANVIRRYGTANINQWGDPENTQVSATVSDRVAWAIATAGDDLDSLAATVHLIVPMQDKDGNTPSMVREMAVMLTGFNLYDWRGSEDVDNQGRPAHRLLYHRDWVYEVFNQVRRGERVIPGAV